MELDRALMQREKDITQKFDEEKDQVLKHQDEVVANAIQAQASGFHTSQLKQLEEETSRLKQIFEDEYNLKLALANHQNVQKTKQLIEDVEGIRTNVSSFQNIADELRENQLKSRELHSQSAALLGLENKLKSSEPLDHVVSALRARCKTNEVVVAALDSLQGVSVGIPTGPELKNRFKVVRKEVRKASLIPEFAPNFLGQAIGLRLFHGLLQAIRK